MYYIVDDEQLVTPRDDNGLKLLREQVSTWELVPVKLTDMGLSQEKPSKVNDDVPDSIKSILADWAATAVPLTEVEKWELKMRDKKLNKDEILNIETEEEKIAKLQVRLIEERAFAKKKQRGNKSGVKLGW